MRRVLRLGCAVLSLGSTAFSSPSSADDLDRAEPYRVRVNAAIDVLSTSKAPPSTSCVSALDEMHATDQQLKQLTGQLDEGGAPQVIAGQQNEVGIARDVMASDLQTAASACGTDADRICHEQSASDLSKACGKLQNTRRATKQP